MTKTLIQKAQSVREVMNSTEGEFVKAVTGFGIADIHGGTSCIKQECARKMFERLQSQGFFIVKWKDKKTAIENIEYLIAEKAKWGGNVYTATYKGDDKWEPTHEKEEIISRAGSYTHDYKKLELCDIDAIADLPPPPKEGE